MSNDLSKKVTPGVVLHKDPARPEAEQPVSDEVRALMERIPKATRPVADIVREKVNEAFPGKGVMVNFQRAFAGRPAHYTITAPSDFDPNHLAEKFGDKMHEADWANAQHVERWTISKELFSDALTPAIPREQKKFAAFTPQITGNIQTGFEQMRHAQFSGEGGTHYTIDGVAPGLDPRSLLVDGDRVDNPAHFKKDDFWKVKIAPEALHEAVGVEVPPPQRPR